MSICCDDLLSLAEKLSHDGDEASFRACVSRSYYALYHEAILAADILCLPKNGDIKSTHEQLICRYTEASKGLAKIGKSIRKQKLMRALADYQLNADLNSSEARYHLSTSRSLIGNLRRISEKITASV